MYPEPSTPVREEASLLRLYQHYCAGTPACILPLCPQLRPWFLLFYLSSTCNTAADSLPRLWQDRDLDGIALDPSTLDKSELERVEGVSDKGKMTKTGIPYTAVYVPEVDIGVGQTGSIRSKSNAGE